MSSQGIAPQSATEGAKRPFMDGALDYLESRAADLETVCARAETLVDKLQGPRDGAESNPAESAGPPPSYEGRIQFFTQRIDRAHQRLVAAISDLEDFI